MIFFKNFICNSNPLEEFNINFYTYTVALNFTISISTIWIQLLIINLFLFCLIIPFKIYLIPSFFQYIKEEAYIFLMDFFKEKNLSLRSVKFYIFYLNLFLFILSCNLNALVHYSQSITAQLFLTLFLALSSFFSLIFIGFILYRVTFYKIIEPEDVPIYLFIFILIIEFFSFIIRPFSLSIRLFANMLAGHMLLMLVGIFLLFFYKFWIILTPYLLTSILLTLIILELIICFIQAYVFVVLFLTYMDQLYKLIFITNDNG